MTNVLHACWRADMRESLALTASSLQLHLFKMISVLLLLCRFETALNFIVCQVEFTGYFFITFNKSSRMFQTFEKKSLKDDSYLS